MTESELHKEGGGRFVSPINEAPKEKHTRDSLEESSVSVSLEAFLRMIDTKLLTVYYPRSKITDLEFMKEMFLLFAKNTQNKINMELMFQEREAFGRSDDDSPTREEIVPIKPRGKREEIDSNFQIEARPDPQTESLTAMGEGEVEFDPPVKKIKERSSPVNEKSPVQDSKVLPAPPFPSLKQISGEKDPRIVPYQTAELPKNYLPMIASSVPEQMVSGKHYMIPAMLDNLELFLYGACASCTQLECVKCQKIKNPYNGIRVEMKAFLLSNQEVTIVGFNKAVFEGFKMDPTVLIPMVKENREQTAAKFLSHYMGHIILFDKCFKGKPIDEKEVTNQFYPLAVEAMAGYHRKLQI